MGADYYFLPLAGLEGAEELGYGTASEMGLRALVEPYLGPVDPDSQVMNLVFDTGKANLYGAPPLSEGFMAADVDTDEAWLLLGRVAIEGQMFIVIPGQGVFVSEPKAVPLFSRLGEENRPRVFESESHLLKLVYGPQ